MAANSKRTRTLIITLSIFASVGIICLLLWLVYFRFEEYTDDAYVHGNMVQLTPQIAGVVTTINAEETYYVKEGQVVVQLDTTDFELALEKSESVLAETVRDVAKLYQDVEGAKAQVRVRESEFIRSKQDFEHREPLVAPGAISLEEFEHAQDALNTSGALLEESRHSLFALEAMTQGTTLLTHPLVLKAKQQVKESWVNLQRCLIKAPSEGYIAKRSVQVGQQVKPGEPLLDIIPLNEIWVEANYKENQLSKMRIGQHVRVRSDIYGGKIEYRGKVVGIGAGTGSVFSVLPPQNATGNWIKIVQRIPVRVSLELEQVKQFPLRLGMSIETHVDLRDMSGPMLASAKILKAIYSTPIFGEQEEGVDARIDEIIEANASR